MIFSRPVIFSVMMMACVSTRAQDLPLIPYGPIPAPPAEQQVVVNPRTVEMIGQALQSTQDVPTRAQWVNDLGLCPVPEARAWLQKLLSDPEPLIRAGAVRSLTFHPHFDPKTLVGLVDDPSPKVRMELIRAGLPQAIVRGLDDEDLTVRTLAFGKSVDESTDQAILRKLSQVDSSLQVLGVRTLGERKYAPSIPVMTELLVSDSVAVRVAVLDAMGKLKSVTSKQIKDQMKHPHPSVRSAALRQALNLDEPDRTVVARVGMSDPDFSVRTEAAKLTVTPNVTWVQMYVDQLSTGYQPLRSASKQALVRLAENDPICAKQVIDQAIQLLTHSDPERRIDGSFLLGRLRSNAALDQHLRLLEEDDWRVVDQACRSMGSIKDPRAGESLVRVIQRVMSEKNVSSPDQVRPRLSAVEQAVLSCAELGYAPVLQTVGSVYLSRTAGESLRTSSIYAMGRLGTAQQVFSSLRPLLSRVQDPEESPLAVIESIKAMGNARVVEAVPILEKIRQNQNLSPDYQYMAHLALARIRGEQASAFTLPPDRREADTSLRAIEP